MSDSALIAPPFAVLIAELRQHLSERITHLETQTTGTASVAAAVQTKVDMLERQWEARYAERNRRDDDFAKEMRAFVTESRTDRARIRLDVQYWAIRVLVAILFSTFSVVAFVLRAGLLALLGK